MSKRKRGDDVDQALLPLPGVERVAPTGTITSSPKLVATKATEPPPKSPPEPSTPIIPRSTEAPNSPRRLEWHGAWDFGRGIRWKILHGDGRSWREFTAWEMTRYAVWYGTPVLFAGVLGLASILSNCSGTPPVTKDGWTPMIERAP